MRSSELRAQAIRELVETEKTYLNQLHSLQKFFADPCQSQGLLPRDVFTKVFGELPVLQALNKELLNKLTAGLEQPAPPGVLLTKQQNNSRFSDPQNQSIDKQSSNSINKQLHQYNNKENSNHDGLNNQSHTTTDTVNEEHGSSRPTCSSYTAQNANLNVSCNNFQSNENVDDNTNDQCDVSDVQHSKHPHSLTFNNSDGNAQPILDNIHACPVSGDNSLQQGLLNKHTNEIKSLLSPYLKINVGEAFLHIAPFLKTYASYASNYQHSLNLIEEHRKSCTKLHKFLKSTESRPEVQCLLVSLLIAPVQRVPRYTLLLAEILRHTPPGHPHHQQLLRGLSLVASAASRVDECVGEGALLQQLMVLQRALQQQKPRIIAPGRTLLKTGLLHKANRSDNGSVPRLFFLFSDILLYTKLPSKPPAPPTHALPASTPADTLPKYDMSMVSCYKPGSLVCCCVLPLRHCSVIPLFAGDDATPVFRVVCCAEDLTLYSKIGHSDGQEWITALRAAIKAAVTNRSTLKKDSSAKRPLRRPAIRRGAALLDTDNTLLQLKASSPLRGLASPVRFPASPAGDSISHCSSSPYPSPASLSLRSIASTNTSVSGSPSTSSRPSSSLRSVTPSPRALFKRLQPHKWLKSTPTTPQDPSIKEASASPSIAFQTEISSSSAGEKHASDDSLNTEASKPKFALGLRRKNKADKSDVKTRPQSEPVPSLDNVRVRSPNYKRRHNVVESNGIAASCIDESPVKIRILNASPFKPNINRNRDIYRSKWDMGEIGLKIPDKDEEKEFDLSTAVKPKIINHSVNKDNLIPLSASRPIPYPGKQARTINGHCSWRPVYNSDMPRDVRPEGNNAWLSNPDILSPDPKIAAAGRKLRRRSRSYTPDSSATGTWNADSTSNLYVSPHRLSHRGSSKSIHRTSPRLFYNQVSSNSLCETSQRQFPSHQNLSPSRLPKSSSQRHKSPSHQQHYSSLSYPLKLNNSPVNLKENSSSYQRQLSSDQIRVSSNPLHRQCKSPSHRHKSPLRYDNQASSAVQQQQHTPAVNLGHDTCGITQRGRSQRSLRNVSSSSGNSNSGLSSDDIRPNLSAANSSSNSATALEDCNASLEGGFDESWRREKLWGRKRALGDFLGTREAREHVPGAQVVKRRVN
uniref:T-lymphoma invasion and metastasis-inducing protein 2-like n=1 Tax=Hirondellea gigas TaxID=1518452 RepID=A0A6A7FX74_9CRUS